jgi:adenylosuccinate synthase
VKSVDHSVREPLERHVTAIRFATRVAGQETLDEVAEVSELPSGARAYIEFVEEQLGV